MPPVKGVELEVTEGITEHSSRVALKGVFQNFGDVVACWVPPIDRRHVDRASVRFGNAASAEAAKASCDAGQVFLQGLPVKVDFRMGGGRRVGNSDLGESGNKNDEGKARAIMDESANNGGGGGGGGKGDGARGRRSRSRRRRDERSRSRRRAASRDRRRSRSRGRVPLQDRFAEPPALPAPVAALQPQEFMPPALPGFPGFPPGMGMPPSLAGLGMPAESAPPQLPVFDPVAEAKKKAELVQFRADRAKQLKRGPGVAALVQGALKRALVTAPVNKRDDEKEKKAQEIAEESDEDDEELLAKKEEEWKVAEAKKKEEQEQQRKAKEKAEKEARERREQAAREAMEAEKALLQKEAETREQRIKASVQAAKMQQAERAAAAGQPVDSLYGNMPQPDLELNSAQAASDAAMQREKDNQNLPLQPVDRSKVLFLDVDGVLRPARAGGFDISTADADSLKSVDTSDFFPSAVKALRHIVDRTSAKIVLSSEWRRSEALCNALSDKFGKDRIRPWTDKTPMNLDLEKGGDLVKQFAERRAREISTWLQEHDREVSGWVVLDDINLGVTDESRKKETKVMQPHLVQTWPLCGLTMGNAKTAVRILNGEMINKVVVERPVAPVGSGGATTAKK
mmetsp:Transcript_95991/g.275564  ORF Transcript_95991/g.275564 Transcript_95991/m.275564 type:complete len:627 (-) Transcript_95991:154-2034(-)